jgi:hypothetical protein
MKSVTISKMADSFEHNRVKDRPFTVWSLNLLQVFLGLGALLGGGAFLLAPDGHLIQMPISHLKNSPFSDFQVPGAVLFTLLGIYPIAVPYSLWRRPDWHWPDIFNPFKRIHWSWTGSMAAGVMLIIWITVQVQWVPLGLVHIIYLGYGIVLLMLTLHPNIRHYYTGNPG